MSPLDTVPAPPAVPPAAQGVLDQLLRTELLGASRYIRQMNEVLSQVAQSWPAPDAAELVLALRRLGDYFIATRGRNTPAIRNAVHAALAGIEEFSGHRTADIRQHLAKRAADLNVRSAQDAASIARCGATLLADCDTLLAFDYSSTVMAVLRELSERGRRLRVIVPESRCLDGGRPIAREAAALGHQVTYTVDMAFAHFLRRAEAVLIGAESIHANGDCLNTIGSYPIAVMAQRYDVPFYAATELTKLDAGSFFGHRSEVTADDLSALLGCDAFGEARGGITAFASELEAVPASLIRAYVTPVGVLLPQHIRGEGRLWLHSLGIETGDDGTAFAP